MKRILTALATVLLCGSLYAQIDPTVEVSRQYKVNVADIDRPQSVENRVADSLQKFDVGFDYSIFDRPYTDLYEFTPYQTDSIAKVEHRRPPFLMAQVGTQLPFAPELMLRSQLVTKPRLNIGAEANLKTAITALDYLGQEGALGVFRLNGDVSTNMKHAWKTGEMPLMLNYGGDALVETLGDNSLAHTVSSFEVGANLGSADPADGSVYYNVDFNYIAATKDLSGLPAMDTVYNNSRMSIKGTIGSSFDVHRIYVNMIYQTAISGTGEQKVNVGLLEFTPIYEYAQGRLKLRAGARFGNKYIDNDASTTIHPEMDVKYEVVKNTLWLRGIVSGGNELNALVDHLHQAPWLCNALKGAAGAAADAIGVRNWETKISLESIIAGRFAASPYFAYNNYSNKLQFRTDFSPTGLPILLPEYTDYSFTQLGVETSWKSRNLMISGNFRHNMIPNKAENPVYMLADWQVDASMEFNIKRRLFLSANYAFESQRLSWGGTIPNYSDLTVTLTGVINRHFAAYIKGGNLLNNPNYRYFEIPELPLNLGGGIRINF